MRLYKEAIKNYNYAIKLNPNDAQYYWNLSEAQGRLGMYTEALKNLKYAQKMDPSVSSI